MRKYRAPSVVLLLLVGSAGLACEAPDASSPEVGIDEGAVSLASDNLFANPSFETTLGGWGSYQGSLSRVALTGAPNGAYVAKVTRVTGTSFSIDDSTNVVASVPAGAHYSASVYVRAATSSSVGKPVVFAVREWSGGTEVKRSKSAPVNLTTAWQKLAITDLAPTAGHALDAFVYQGSASNGDAFYADAFELRKVTQADGGATCTPTTCAAQGKNCGSIADGCGGTLSCGTCASGLTCGLGGPNVCGTSASTLPAQNLYFNYGDSPYSTSLNKAGSAVVAGRGSPTSMGSRQSFYQGMVDAGGYVFQYIDWIDMTLIGGYAGEYDKIALEGLPILPGGLSNWGGVPIVDIGDPAVASRAYTATKWFFNEVVAGRAHANGLFLDVLGPQLWTAAWSQMDHTRFANGAVAVAKAISKARDEVYPHGVLIVNNTWPAPYAGTVPGIDGMCMEHHGNYATWMASSFDPKQWRLGWSMAITTSAAECSTYSNIAGVAWCSTQSDYSNAAGTWTSSHALSNPY